jgi:hypothetical protein
MFLSTRTDPLQEVKLEASREPGGKITQIEISFPSRSRMFRANETASLQLTVK